MNSRQRPGRGARARGPRSSPKRPAPKHYQEPWVQLKQFPHHPLIWRRNLGPCSDGILPGDVVNVYDQDQSLLGAGLYAPRSQYCLRMLRTDGQSLSDDFLKQRVAEAVSYRHELLKLPEYTDAYRVIHGEGDGFPGLVVDRLGPVLSVEVFTEAWIHLLAKVLPALHEALGTSATVIRADHKAQEAEDFLFKDQSQGSIPKTLKIHEGQLRFAVDLEQGHKTGFFCDQREARQELAQYVRGKNLLDVCCYSGGFALAAKVLGQAKKATGVDFDKPAIDMAKRNAKLNQCQIKWVQGDAFHYLRQQQQNQQRFSAMVLDPPKFVPDRATYERGRRKYIDLNRLAFELLEPGSMMLSCSCSGLISESDFIEILQTAARQAQRRVQVVRMTGAAADHPVRLDCPESRYLKAAWLLVS